MIDRRMRTSLLLMFENNRTINPYDNNKDKIGKIDLDDIVEYAY